jgi:hypothetical protein
MKIIKAFALLIVGVALGSASQIGQSPSPEEVLGRQVKEVDLNNVSLVNAVTRTLHAAHVPGGIAIGAVCGDQPIYLLNPSGPTLANALDSIVSASPQYRWFVRRGVVNVLPTSGNPPLLDLRITRFKTITPLTVEEMVGQLLTMAVVREAIVQLDLVAGGGEIGISELRRPGFDIDQKSNRITLDCRNATVVEVLNAIAQAHGSAVWEYREQNCGGRNQFSIRFLIS